jgi:hypothetical protein
VVDLDLTKGHVFVREDWHYTWTTARGEPPWTPQEQLAYHRAVDRAVWGHWSQRARIQVRPGAYALHPETDHLKWQIAGRALTLSFDVRSVRGKGHWEVNAKKVPSSIQKKPQAKVINEDGEILLYSTDLLVTTARRFEGDKPHFGFSVAAHEFGHTFGGPNDEWRTGQPHNKDRESIMNIGETLRARHLVAICHSLGKLVKGCIFIPLTTP